MAFNNCVTLTGRMGRDPESKQTAAGQVVTFSMAVNDFQKKKNDEGDWTTYWFNVTCWGKAGEKAMNGSKGAMVHVQGKMTNRKYEANDGQTKEWHEVVADDLSVERKSENTRSAAATTRATDPIDDDDVPF